MYSNPIFTIFGQGVYLYGICMAVGIICCFIFLYCCLVRLHSDEESINKLLLLGVVATGFGVFMAAVFQGIYDAIAGKGFSLSGLTFYGGLIGGVCGFLIVYLIYVYVVAPRAKRRVLQNHMNTSLNDGLPFVPIGICIAHAFGRLGCTFAGCCYGKPTDAWYGIYIREIGEKVIPTATIEMIFLILLTVVMCVLYFRFNFKNNLAVYCIAYGVFRYFIDFARGDDRGQLIAGMATPSQFWSLLMIALGIGLIFFTKFFLVKFMKHPELQPQKTAEETATENGAGAAVSSDKTIASADAASSDGETAKKEPLLTAGTWTCVGFMVLAVILAVVGVSVNFVGGSASDYKLGSILLNVGYSNATAAYALAYASMGLMLVLALGYAAVIVLSKRYGVDNRAVRYTMLGVSMAIIALSIIMIIFANNLYEGSHVNFLNAGTGAKLLLLGCIVGGAAGMSAALKKKI
ncbi:MAG: prolipoprotein diacylglyceryl transferase [Clostridia bacterium]|nr:prolipoprotein diacylglyceryl transferase [Clostridia bacterium]